MNLSEALDAALPEIPQARLARNRPPRLDPDLIVRDDLLDGEPIVGIFQRGKSSYFRFSPAQWELAKLFDGIRSYEEIASAFTSQTDVPTTVEEVRSFAENMDESDFWHKTPQEKNLALNQKLVARREHRGRSKVDLAHIGFSAWDPNQYFDWLDKAIGKYIYSQWCVLAVLALFIFETIVFISKWSILGPDTALYFSFSRRPLLAVGQFWILFLILGFFHETAHGLTCKHYGGQVHSMGFMLIYLAPAFYVDVTEIWISATKIQRLATIIAGIWIEMVFCGMAMLVWINTRTGEWIHDFAYQIILFSGLTIAVINLNPLIKIDGYYFFTELIGIPDLKERSTAFLSGWFQNRVLRLPVEMPIVPRRRAPFFIIYAFLSGLYSYVLLFVAVRLCYRVAAHWLAEFALIPAGIAAFFIFRSRMSSLRRVAVEVWQHNFTSEFGWGSPHTVAIVAIVAALFVPFWRDRVSAFYVIEPVRSQTVHASITGRIDQVLVQEGENVRAGQPLLRMSSLDASSMRSSSASRVTSSRFQAFNSQLQGQTIGSVAADLNGAARLAGLAHEAQTSLLVVAPFDGIVLTESPGLLLDQDVASGQRLLDFAESGPRIARIFIPASALDRVHTGDEVALAIPGEFSLLRLKLPPLGGDAVTLPKGLVSRSEFEGVQQPVYYDSRIVLPQSPSSLSLGTSGEAKIFGVRRSLAGRAGRGVLNLVRAHVW